jgi:SAM-dependent methyltransferase
VLAVLTAALCLIAVPPLSAQEERPSRGRRSSEENRNRREEALQALCDRLGVGEGSVVADIGCGGGRDSFIFAGIVGPRGAVFAEEIDAGKLKRVLDDSTERELFQVVPVLGQTTDPRLPDGRADLIYMHRVFHHFSRPRSMLRSFWFDLEPGGHLVIVDQQKGPLRDWTPFEKREGEHHWTGETAVVRMAREAGFEFVDNLDPIWVEDSPFVLAFRRPLASHEPDGDPAPSPELDAPAVLRVPPVAGRLAGNVLVVALDAGRGVIPLLRERAGASSRLQDVVLEEWALSKEELPEGADSEGGQVLRTEKGDLQLADDTVLDLVLFVDAYHRLWDPKALLGTLRGHLSPEGRIVVLDVSGPQDESRRVAGHRRRVAPSRVRSDMEAAGLVPGEEVEYTGDGRFLLVFRPAAGEKLEREELRSF